MRDDQPGTASPGQAGGTVLVCGGAGYIGSHVVRMLTEAGRRCVVVDDLSTGHRASLGEDVELLAASVGDKAGMAEVFASHDVAAVMHFCANAYVGESVEDPRKYYRNNVANGLALLEAMLDAGVRNLVFSSSCTVYGHPPRVPIDESCRVSPINPYGRTKVIFEQMLADFDQAYGLRSVSLRYFNAAGAMPDGSIGEDHDPETHLIPLVLRQALRVARPEAASDGRDGPLEVFGDDYETRDGTCVRDYVHVLDLGSAHLQALDYLLGGGESMVMNLANGAGFSVREIIAACQRVTGVEIPFRIAPRRPGDPAELVGSADLAARVLGWRPKYTDIDGIIETAWKWHSRNPAGFSDHL
jgi:UDP-glucose 4-epimerase